MTLAKMDQLTLWLETVKFQLSNWNGDIDFNVEVWEDMLCLKFKLNGDFAFYDLSLNDVFSNWEFEHDSLTMSVKLG